MELRTGPGEPAVTRWRRTPLGALAADLAGGGQDAAWVVAIAGRSGGGKSTLSHRLQSLIPDAAVVETDDLAWHEPMFAWADAAAEQVLRPFRDGQGVRYRPPAWVSRDRPGAVEVDRGPGCCCSRASPRRCGSSPTWSTSPSG